MGHHTNSPLNLFHYAQAPKNVEEEVVTKAKGKKTEA